MPCVQIYDQIYLDALAAKSELPLCGHQLHQPHPAQRGAAQAQAIHDVRPSTPASLRFLCHSTVLSTLQCTCFAICLPEAIWYPALPYWASAYQIAAVTP